MVRRKPGKTCRSTLKPYIICLDTNSAAFKFQSKNRTLALLILKEKSTMNASAQCHCLTQLDKFPSLRQKLPTKKQLAPHENKAQPSCN